MGQLDRNALDVQFENAVRDMASKPEATQQLHGEAESIFYSAASFYAGALRCLADVREEDGTYTSHVLPAIVNFAFAIELFIKSELSDAGVPTRGHRLDQLYTNVPASRKSEIEAEYLSVTGRDAGQFVADLAELASAFVDWRYVYEQTGTQSVVVHRLGEINYAFCVSAEKAHTGWQLAAESKAAFVNSLHNFQRISRFPNGRLIRIVPQSTLK